MKKKGLKVSFITALLILLSMSFSSLHMKVNANALHTGFVSSSSSVNLYTSQNTSSKVIVKIKTGEKITKVQKKSNNWYKASYGNKTGYIKYAHVILDKKPTVYAGMGVLKSNTKEYVSANIKSRSTGTLKSGTKVIITGIVGTWYQIKNGNSYTYIRNKSIVVAKNETEASFKGKATIKATVNSMNYPNSQSTYNGSFSKGDTVKIIAKTKSFYKIQYSGNKIGYILISRADLHQTSKKAATNSIIKFKKDSKYYRNPSKHSKLQGTVKQYATATLVYSTPNWYGIQAKNGVIYWVEKVNATYAGVNKKTEFKASEFNPSLSSPIYTFTTTAYLNNATIHEAIDLFKDDVKIVKTGEFANDLHSNVMDLGDADKAVKDLLSGKKSKLGIYYDSVASMLSELIIVNPMDSEYEQLAMDNLKKFQKEGKGVIIKKELTINVGLRNGLELKTTVKAQKE